MKKANTAIVCLSPYSGGMETDVIKLAKTLSSYIKITIVAKENHFIANSKEDYLGLKHIELETISFQKSFSFSIISKMRRIIKNKKIKNVIFFGASELKSLYFSFLGNDINLIIRHGTTKKSSKKDIFHKLIYSGVNYHIAISNHILKNIRNIIPYKNEKQLKLIYPSIKLGENNAEDNEVLTIVHVGRIIAGKGQLDAIKACDVLYKEKRDFVFYLVGALDKNYEKEFLDAYNQLPYKNNIKLVGYTTDVNVYLEKANLFIFPSDFEGFGNAFVEALAYGIYCISYRNTTFIEFNELNLYFGLAENKNIDDLRYKIVEYLKNNKSIEKKKLLNNKEIINKLFSKDKEVSSYLEILK